MESERDALRTGMSLAMAQAYMRKRQRTGPVEPKPRWTHGTTPTGRKSRRASVSIRGDRRKARELAAGKDGRNLNGKI